MASPKWKMGADAGLTVGELLESDGGVTIVHSLGDSDERSG